MDDEESDEIELKIQKYIKVLIYHVKHFSSKIAKLNTVWMKYHINTHSPCASTLVTHTMIIG